MNVFFGLTILMFVHWFADFFLQNDKMALGKSESVKILSQHCIIYAGMMAVVIQILFNVYVAGLFLLWMFFTHFVIDFVTARANKKLWLNNQRHWFFVMVGFDQFLHVTTIIWFYAMVVDVPNYFFK